MTEILAHGYSSEIESTMNTNMFFKNESSIGIGRVNLEYQSKTFNLIYEKLTKIDTF